MSAWDTFMADTVGVVYRAGTGNVDPWTENELVSNATDANVAAGMDPATAATQAQSDVSTTLSTFTLGGGDRVGAQPGAGGSGINLPSWQAFKDAFMRPDNIREFEAAAEWYENEKAGLGTRFVT